MEENGKCLVFALCKGRLAFKTLELLEKIGIHCEEIKDKDSRKLVFVNEELKVKSTRTILKLRRLIPRLG